MHDTKTSTGESAAPAEEAAPRDVTPLGLAPRPRLYLRLAVTGHRDAARLNESNVRRGFARAFDACADIVRLQHESAPGLYAGDGAELVLLSALAEGADQIAVDVFTARENPGWLRPRAEVVIPFDIDGYASTMDDAAARARMREMAKAASAKKPVSDPDTRYIREPRTCLSVFIPSPFCSDDVCGRLTPIPRTGRILRIYSRGLAYERQLRLLCGVATRPTWQI